MIHKSYIKIAYPAKTNELAEFIGILLGDGCISKTNYEMVISLNSENDSEYVDYTKNLILNLFDIVPRQYKVKGRKVVRLTIASIRLFEFLQSLDMPIGHADKYIPNWILTQDNFVKNFLRGLFDTDGSLFLSSRRSILNISVEHENLRNQVISCLTGLGIEFSVVKNNINLSSIRRIEKFLTLIGTSNTKNVVKFVEYMKNKKTIRTLNLPEYLIKYRQTKLPFMGL